MTSTGSRIPELPIEVMERIIDFVDELGDKGDIFDNDNDEDLYTRVSRRSVWMACALACRVMVARSQYWLFRRILISTKRQAESLVQILRNDPKPAEHTRRLMIVGSLTNDHLGQKTWISWIAQFLAPRMVNLFELYLENDVFSTSHPSFPMSLAAFKSVRTLTLMDVRFSSCGHCTRLVRAFPRLTHLRLGSADLGPASQRPLNLWHSHKTRSRESKITHLEIQEIPREPSMKYFTKWFMSSQHHNSLRTLSVNLPGNEHDSPMTNVARCAPNVRSIFLVLYGDSPVPGFEHCKQLQMLHLLVFNDGTFPVKALLSIALSISSQYIQRVFVYVKGGTEGEISNLAAGDLDMYRQLDEALHRRRSSDLKVVVYVLGRDLTRATSQWRERLSVALPKLSAQGKLIVEPCSAEQPVDNWQRLRDGF